MFVLFILLSGLTSDLQPNDDCVWALHNLRTEGGMDLVSTKAVEETLIYTLVESKPKSKEMKTAILGCQIKDNNASELR